MTLPAHLMQPITQPEVKPALMTQPILQNAQVQVASSDLISRIWNAILECFKSCFSWVTLKKNSDYEFRLTTDESQIQARLQRQMQHGLQQMQVEPAKSFRYQIAPSTWDMHEETVGGYRVGISHAQGRRLTMEDEHLAVSFNLLIAGRSYPLQLFGIFDGHGGPKASQFIRDNLKNKLNESLLEFNPQGLTDAGIWKALKMTTVRLNREFIQKYPAVADTQGSTANPGQQNLDGQRGRC